MGMKRKDLAGATESPSSEKDYQNQKVYPNLSASGEQARLMGADDLEQGECVMQTVKWRIKRLTKDDKGAEIELEMVSGSDLTPCDDEDAEDEKNGGDDEAKEGESPGDDDESPGIAMILSGSKLAKGK